MSYSYNYLPDIAIADVAFHARGDSPAELFAAAALATTEVMIKPADIHKRIECTVSLRADNMEDLLYEWLSELIYLKDVERLIFIDFNINITGGDSTYDLQATLGGEEIDQNRHELGRDVKAVTYHLFEIKEVNNGYEARVVLDI